MRGITRSEMTIAGRNDVTFASPSSPSVADSATKPQLFMSCSRPIRAAESSSTISTRSAVDFNVEGPDEIVSSPVIIVTRSPQPCHFYILRPLDHPRKLFRSNKLPDL